MDGWVDAWMHGWMDGWKNGWMKWIHERMHEQRATKKEVGGSCDSHNSGLGGNPEAESWKLFRSPDMCAENAINRQHTGK